MFVLALLLRSSRQMIRAMAVIDINSKGKKKYHSLEMKSFSALAMPVFPVTEGLDEICGRYEHCGTATWCRQR
jgi:hypothetical protein